MKFLLVQVLLLAAYLLSVNAARKPNWGLRCGPYTQGGRRRPGARGPCINTCFAINCRGKSNILTYRPALMSQNRRRSGCKAQSTSPCSRLRYRASGNTCDEFPLASTQEGGTGSILRCVPGVENSSQGGQFRSYIRANNVRSGDTFRQTFVLRPGSVRYCAGSNSCTNDGFQFRYNGGGSFSNARRELDGSNNTVEASFENATSTVEDFSLPVFRTSGGHYVTMLDDGETPLNSTIWIDGDDGGLQTVEKKLTPDEIHELVMAPHNEI